jgi:hypothetical protein
MSCLCWTRKKPTAEAATAQKGAEPPPAPEDEPTDLWDRAYKALRNDKDGAKLVKYYEDILSAHLGESTTVAFASVGSSERQKQMLMLVQKKLKEMDAAQWKFNIGDNEVVVREQVNRIIKGVLFAKDFVSQAVSLSADPHAGLAWAGVCMVLPVSPVRFSTRFYFWASITSLI